MDDRAKALDRYLKLVALGEGLGDRPEGKTALGLAAKLMGRWKFSATEVGVRKDTGARVPSATVPLAGRETERYREHYRATLLAVLAETVGCTAGYNPDTWTGAVYGEAELAKQITEIYAELSEDLARSFHRWWIPRRFGGTPRHMCARNWWYRCMRELLEILREGRPEPVTESDSVALVLASAARLEGAYGSSSDVSAAAKRAVHGVPRPLLDRIIALQRRGTTS